MENNFEKAYSLAQKEFSETEIEANLKSDDDTLKQITILQIENIPSQDFAILLTHNLTNQSGPIREACSYKISEMIKLYPQFFQCKNIYDKFINSFIDVNPNVVRFMLESIENIENKKYIFDNLIVKLKSLYTEIINKPRRGKVEEHIFTKKCFKIYWILEVIKNILKYDKTLIYEKSKVREDLYNLISDLSKFEEYTVREKIAQILAVIDINGFEKIKEQIKNDENYFVKRYE